MTLKQLQLFDFIKARILAVGSSPSYTEMRKHMNVISNQSVKNLLVGIEEDGYITRQQGKLRGTQLTQKGKEFNSKIIKPSENKPQQQVYQSITTSSLGNEPIMTNTQLETNGYPSFSKGGDINGSS